MVPMVMKGSYHGRRARWASVAPTNPAVGSASGPGSGGEFRVMTLRVGSHVREPLFEAPKDDGARGLNQPICESVVLLGFPFR